jgi:regulator of nonsense transcripts 1
MKVCFFGDPKQRELQLSLLQPLNLFSRSVPPYGAEQASLETIFDVKHLKKTSYFLNTQCKI